MTRKLKSMACSSRSIKSIQLPYRINDIMCLTPDHPVVVAVDVHCNDESQSMHDG